MSFISVIFIVFDNIVHICILEIKMKMCGKGEKCAMKMCKRAGAPIGFVEDRCISVPSCMPDTAPMTNR